MSASRGVGFGLFLKPFCFMSRRFESQGSRFAIHPFQDLVRRASARPSESVLGLLEAPTMYGFSIRACRSFMIRRCKARGFAPLNSRSCFWLVFDNVFLYLPRSSAVVLSLSLSVFISCFYNVAEVRTFIPCSSLYGPALCKVCSC